MEEVTIEDIKELPLMFEAYTINTKVVDIIRSYRDKYGFEPKTMYIYKKSKVSMIAVEVTHAFKE